MKEQVVEIEEQLGEVEASAQRQVMQSSQKTQLAQETLKKCKEDLRRTTQDLGYKRSALNRAQEMNSEYEAELRELRTLKETSGDAEILKRELSGYPNIDNGNGRSDELYQTVGNDVEETTCRTRIVTTSLAERKY
jgi:hypothetical protein